MTETIVRVEVASLCFPEESGTLLARDLDPGLYRLSHGQGRSRLARGPVERLLEEG